MSVGCSAGPGSQTTAAIMEHLERARVAIDRCEALTSEAGAALDRAVAHPGLLGFILPDKDNPPCAAPTSRENTTTVQQVLTQEAPLAAAAGTMQYDAEQRSAQANPASPADEDSDEDSPPLIESDDEEESEKDKIKEDVKAEDTTPTRAEGHEVAVFEMDPTKSAQAALDFKMRLGLRIAAGPEAFFALADTKQDDILSPRGWLEACKSSLGNVDEALCLSLFDEMVIYVYMYMYIYMLFVTHVHVCM